MTDLEQELQAIFDKRKNEYQPIFDNGEGLQAKADNARNFSRINEEFIDEMIASANAYLERNSSVSQDEAQDIIKKMIPKFSWVMLTHLINQNHSLRVVFNFCPMQRNKICDSQVFQRIGMALVSAQRVEFITRELVNNLIEFDKSLYELTSDEFLGTTSKSQLLRKQTLGQVFRLLKLNPTLVIEDELNSYLATRNLFVHGFWESYLKPYSNEQKQNAIGFCNEFGKSSMRLERFFKGLLFLLMSKCAEITNLPLTTKRLELKSDYEYFLKSLGDNQLLE